MYLFVSINYLGIWSYDRLSFFLLSILSLCLFLSVTTIIIITTIIVIIIIIAVSSSSWSIVIVSILVKIFVRLGQKRWMMSSVRHLSRNALSERKAASCFKKPFLCPTSLQPEGFDHKEVPLIQHSILMGILNLLQQIHATVRTLALQFSDF
jgi:hypothetical protein